MTVSAAVPTSQEPRKAKTRIARFCLPQIDAHSALLPPDSWILKTVRDLARDNKSFHGTIGHAALYAGGGLFAVATGVTALLMLPLVLPVAAATGIAALGAAVFAGLKAKTHLERFKTETLPDLRNQIGKKYLQYKMSELKSAWQKNLGERRRNKPVEKKPAVAAEKKKQAVPASGSAAIGPATIGTTPQKKLETDPENKPAENKPLGGAFGAWAVKTAEEAAKKRAQKQAPAPKENNAPKAGETGTQGPKPPDA